MEHEETLKLLKNSEIQLNRNKSIIRKLKKKIERLEEQANNKGITNNTTNNNNIIIQNTTYNILNYKDTNPNLLLDKDYQASLNRRNNCISELIKRLHFNPSTPENHNIYISNLNNKYINLLEDGKWVVKDKVMEIDDLIDSKEMILEEWLEEHGDKFPGLQNKYEHYLKSKEDVELNKQLKEEIKKVLYNNRHLIEKLMQEEK
jgi:hypothetical protein